MLKFKNKITIVLLVLILIAGVLRFYKLGQVPVSLYWDEVSIGYNAYSILKTGKDEYGETLPLRFKTFGEYKLPLYVYLTVPAIKVFGLNEFAVRFPSAFFGTLTVLLTYFLVKELFRKTAIRYPLAAISAFLLAISPWHLQLSRAGFESNLALFFFCLGLFLLLKKSFLSAIPLTLTLYSYYSFWITVPLTLLFFFVTLAKRKILLLSMLILIFSLPLVPSVFYQEHQARFEQVSIFDEPRVLEISLARKARSDNRLTSRIFYHRFFIFLQEALKNYSLHFSPDFLFFKGDGSSRHSPYKSGLLFPITIPFVALGLYKLLKYQEKLSFWLLLIAPVSAAFSLPSPHALRTELMVIPWQIVTAFGLVGFCKFVKKGRGRGLRFVICLSLFGLFAFSFLFYLDNYYTHSFLNQAFDWGDGYKEMLFFVKENQEKFDKIYVTGSRWQPYIYTLFYLGYEPIKYQQEGSDHGHFGKYFFGETGWDQKGKSFYKTKVSLAEFLDSGNNLIVVSSDDEYVDLPIFKTIYSVNGSEVFLIYKT